MSLDTVYITNADEHPDALAPHVRTHAIPAPQDDQRDEDLQRVQEQPDPRPRYPRKSFWEKLWRTKLTVFQVF